MKKLKFLTLNETRVAIGRLAAAPHETKKQVATFEAYADPDLTEGKLPLQFKGIVLVRLERSNNFGITHRDLASDFMHEAYGNRIQYIMSCEPTIGWMIKASSGSAVTRLCSSACKLLAVIEQLNIRNPLWNDLNFYHKMGWR